MEVNPGRDSALYKKDEAYVKPLTTQDSETGRMWKERPHLQAAPGQPCSQLFCRCHMIICHCMYKNALVCSVGRSLPMPVACEELMQLPAASSLTWGAVHRRAAWMWQWHPSCSAFPEGKTGPRCVDHFCRSTLVH